MSRCLTAVFVCVTAIVLFCESASAAPGTGGGAGSGGASNGVITAQAEYRSSSSSSSSGGAGASQCSWTLSDGEAGAPVGASAVWPMVIDGVVNHLWLKSCAGQAPAYYAVPEQDPKDLVPQLLDELRSRVLPRPVPTFELLDPRYGWAYVKTPLDFAHRSRGQAEVAGALRAHVPQRGSRRCRHPQRQVRPLPHPGGQQLLVGHRHQLDVGADHVGARAQQAAQRGHPRRAGGVDPAGPALLDAAHQQSARSRASTRAIGWSRCSGTTTGPPAARRRSPPPEAVDVVVRADDQPGAGQQHGASTAAVRVRSAEALTGPYPSSSVVHVGFVVAGDRPRRPARVRVQAGDERVPVHAGQRGGGLVGGRPALARGVDHALRDPPAQPLQRCGQGVGLFAVTVQVAHPGRRRAGDPRVNVATSCPRASAASTTCRPRKRVPPRTRSRIAPPSRGAGPAVQRCSPRTHATLRGM